MFSPVFNFPVQFTGPSQKIIANGTAAGASASGIVVTGAPGIWNGASDESLIFVQRHDEFELIGRIPVYQGDNCRVYGLAGARIVQIWDASSGSPRPTPTTLCP